MNNKKQNLELFAERYVNSFREIEGLINLTKDQIHDDGAFCEVQRINYLILQKLFRAEAYEEILLAMTNNEEFPDVDAVLEKYYYQKQMKGFEKYLKNLEEDKKEDKNIVKKFREADLYYLCRGDYISGEQKK